MTRLKAIEHLKNIVIYSFQDGYTDEARQALKMAIKALEEPERRKGKWERHYCEDGNPDGWQCDCCGEWFYFGDMKPNFCPNCGADMRGDTDGKST